MEIKIKKILFLILLICIGNSLIFSTCEIIIISPKPGDVFYSGSTVKIEYGVRKPNSRFDKYARADKCLFRGTHPPDNFIGYISDEWTIPFDLPADVYTLHLKCESYSTPCTASVKFIIKKRISKITRIPGTLWIQVKSPQANQSYKVLNPIKIIWDKNFKHSRIVPGDSQFMKISLFKQNKLQEVIAQKTKNTGEISWVPQKKYAYTQKKNAYTRVHQFYIQVSTLDKKYIGKSGKFRLIE